MDNDNALLVWAKQWHYPCIVLSKSDKIRHGKNHWQHLASCGDSERQRLAWQRIAQWDARTNKKSVQ